MMQSAISTIVLHLPWILALTSVFCVQVTLAFSFKEATEYVFRPWCFRECCQNMWINSTNSTGLQQALTDRLFGQHLVNRHVVGAVKGHLMNNEPEKPLVLSFHGRTGTGKNFVAKIIAESIYKEGLNSKYVHLFSANDHFPHADYLNDYKDKLRNAIKQSLLNCPRQLFIFDEMEDMPKGLLDSIKPFLDYNVYLDGINFKKAIYIFLSNTAATEITQKTAEHLTGGGNREDIKLRDMEEIIERVAFNSGGGFSKSRLIDNYVVSHYVPFLPLERHHVRDCIRAALRKHRHMSRFNEAAVDDVLAHLQFVPKETGMFALKGCKNVAEKVTLVVHQMRKEL